LLGSLNGIPVISREIMGTHEAISAWLFIICLALAWYNTSTTWLAQLVTYPLFEKVGADRFPKYHQSYNARIKVPVITPAISLMVLSPLIVWFRAEFVPVWVAWAGLSLECGNAISTATLQIPSHNQLSRAGFDVRVHHRLVATNWIRTVGFTAHAVLLLWTLEKAIVR